MDRTLVDEKLEGLRHCVVRIRDKCPDAPVTLAGDEDLQDIVAMNLARAVQLCVDIAAHLLAETNAPVPHTMGEAFSALEALNILSPETSEQMRKAVGFRNIAVHAYEKIDWSVVHSVCQHRLVDFKQFTTEVSQFLEG